MNLPTQPYKGTRDFYPEDKRIQKYMFGILRDVAESFGYQEYDAPIIEPLDIYLAKTGEEIVNNQLYSFDDKGGRKVAIRPEMTPSVSRMVAGRRQELAYPLRWYSTPSLWRYERPQRGRLREHYQLNVDIFGVAHISADHEIILVADSIMKAFKAPAGSYEIRISSRKLVEDFLKDLDLSPDEHQVVLKHMDRYRKIAENEWTSLFESMLSKAKADLLIDKLKVLMSTTRIEDIPAELAGHESAKKLHSLFQMLTASGIDSAKFDFSVVRGMDYYDDIIFEVFDTNPENNRSMAGGGRYDGLVGLFGVEPVPTVGFAMGDVTLQQFLELHNLLPALHTEVDFIAIIIGDVYQNAQPVLAHLRGLGLNVAVDTAGRKLDSSIRHAAKAGVDGVIFLGEQEIRDKVIKFKHLHTGEEMVLNLEDFDTYIDGWRRPRAESV